MLRVVQAPDPIVSPADLVGGADVAAAERAIAAATRTLDGPDGKLGRCLGPQTLELTLDGWCWNRILPCGPVIEIVSVKYFDADDVEQTIDASEYTRHDDRIWFGKAFGRPCLGQPSIVKIRYRAGYDGETTGDVPPEAIQAVILMAQHSLSTGAENLFVASEEVEGVGSTRYVVSDQADGLVRRAVDSLVSGLKVYAL